MGYYSSNSCSEVQGGREGGRLACYSSSNYSEVQGGGGGRLAYYSSSSYSEVQRGRLACYSSSSCSEVQGGREVYWHVVVAVTTQMYREVEGVGGL